MQIHHGSEQLTAQNSPQQRQLSYKTSDRMAGSIAVWSWKQSPETPQAVAEDRLTQAASSAQTEEKPSDFAMALLEADAKPLNNQDQNQSPIQEESFGFGDLLDIANPLQHLPVIGPAYRTLTGDEIKQSGQIIGGAIYGGAAGAALNIANAVVKTETGYDTSGFIAQLLTSSDKIETAPITPNAAETALSQANKPAMPASEYMLSFAEQKLPPATEHQATPKSHRPTPRYND